MTLYNSMHPKEVQKMPIYNKVLKDLRQYCESSFHFEPRIITICVLFYKTVVNNLDQEILETLVKRAN